MEGDIAMDVAALSMNYSTASVANDVSIAVFNKNLDTYKNMGENLTKMMEQSVNQGLGQNIDIRV